MAVNNYYGPKRPRGETFLSGAVGTVLHMIPGMERPVRVWHIGREIFQLSRAHGVAIAEAFRGKRKFSEIPHNMDEFKRIYADMSIPNHNMRDRNSERIFYVSDITDWANYSSWLTLDRIGNHTQGTEDIPQLGSYINTLIDHPDQMLVRKPKKRQQAEEALRKVFYIRNEVIKGVINDATIATAELYYERSKELHIGILTDEILKLAVGTGVGIVAGAALAAASFPLAAPAGIAIAAYVEHQQHVNREIPIITDDGRDFKKERYRFRTGKELASAVAQLAQATDELLNQIDLPSDIQVNFVREKNISSRLSIVRTWEFVNALIATHPNYYQLIHKFQAYNLFVYALAQQEGNH